MVADMESSEENDLAGVAGTPEEPLVAGHPGIKTQFSRSGSGKTGCLAPENSSVL